MIKWPYGGLVWGGQFSSILLLQCIWPDKSSGLWWGVIRFWTTIIVNLFTKRNVSINLICYLCAINIYLFLTFTFSLHFCNKWFNRTFIVAIVFDESSFPFSKVDIYKYRHVSISILLIWVSKCNENYWKNN